VTDGLFQRASARYDPMSELHKLQSTSQYAGTL
jgi:hypothetical protein